MPFVKVWIHFVYEESLGFRGSSAKADKKSDCSPLAEASGNMESRGNLGRSGDKRLHGCGYKCQLYPESNPDYVPSRASLIFGSGYVDCTNVARTGLDR